MAYYNLMKMMEGVRRVKCPYCKGKGIVSSGKPHIRDGHACSVCNGAGKVEGVGFYTPMGIAPGEILPSNPTSATRENDERGEE